MTVSESGNNVRVKAPTRAEIEKKALAAGVSFEEIRETVASAFKEVYVSGASPAETMKRTGEPEE